MFEMAIERSMLNSEVLWRILEFTRIREEQLNRTGLAYHDSFEDDSTLTIVSCVSCDRLPGG